MRAGQATSSNLHEAAFNGMRWLERASRQPEGFTSDEARAFLIVRRNALDPFLTDYARRLHRRLITSYKMDMRRLRELTHPNGFIDYLSFCVQSEELGAKHRQKDRVVKAVLERGNEFFQNVWPRKHHYLNCLALINYYHFKRLRVPLQLTMEKIIESCGATALDRSVELSQDEFEQQLYFVTHWAYALSDYGCAPLNPREHTRLYRFLRRVLPEALESGNLETLAEVVGCLKIFGHRNGDIFLRPALRNILRRQNPDGSWGSVVYGTARHTTCVAVLALYEYRAHQKSKWGPVARRSLLKNAASRRWVASV